MPSLPFVPNVAKLQLFWDVNGFGAMTVHHLLYTGGPPDAATCATIATDVRNNSSSHLTAAFPSGVSINEHRVTDLSSATGAEGQNTTSVVGTEGASALLTNQTCFVTHYPTALRYRGGHPRTYWPMGQDGDLVDTSHWSSSFVAAATALVQAWVNANAAITAGGTSITSMCAVSYFHGGALRTSPVVLTYSGVVGRPKVGAQRRRIAQGVHV